MVVGTVSPASDDSERARRSAAHVRAWALLKLDVFLTVPLMIFYLLSFLDRTNIGNARVGGLQTGLKITNAQYSLAVTVTYIAHAAVEFPANLLYKKIGPHIMMPAVVIAFGTVTTLQGLVRSYKGLLAARVFLGLCEGGLLPGVTLYISSFYPRRNLQLRFAVLFTATSLAGAFSGLLATGILHMDGIGGLDGWAWIFILEGILSVLLAICVSLVLPASIHAARFLTPAEKDALESALAPDGLSHAAAAKTRFNVRHIRAALRTPHLWLVSPLFFFNGARLFGLAIFAPSIVNDLIGHHPIRAQLLTVPPYAVAFVVSLAVAIVADKRGYRGGSSILFSLISIIGYSISLTKTDEHVNYFALFVQTVGASGVPPAITAWAANNFSPHYKRATALAVVLIMSVAGGILSTWIYTDPPRYRRPNKINLALSVAEVVFAAASVAYLRRENAAKAKARASLVTVTENEKSESAEDDMQEVDDRDVDFEYCL